MVSYQELPAVGIRTASVSRRARLERVNAARRRVGHAGHTANATMDTLEARSRDVQERTFCKWSVCL